jgi:hypothetical protein
MAVAQSNFFGFDRSSFSTSILWGGVPLTIFSNSEIDGISLGPGGCPEVDLFVDELPSNGFSQIVLQFQDPVSTSTLNFGNANFGGLSYEPTVEMEDDDEGSGAEGSGYTATPDMLFPSE